jgi:hypothetical protein
VLAHICVCCCVGCRHICVCPCVGFKSPMPPHDTGCTGIALDTIKEHSSVVCLRGSWPVAACTCALLTVQSCEVPCRQRASSTVVGFADLAAVYGMLLCCCCVWWLWWGQVWPTSGGGGGGCQSQLKGKIQPASMVMGIRGVWEHGLWGSGLCGSTGGADQAPRGVWGHRCRAHVSGREKFCAPPLPQVTNNKRSSASSLCSVWFAALCCCCALL